MALLATVLVLVLVPQQADRTMRLQLERIPVARDTLALQRQLDALSRRYGALRRADSAHTEALRVGDRRATADDLSDATARGESGGASVAVEQGADASSDADLAELRQRLSRARSVPLTESYRDLALARAVRGDARVRMLADSLEALDRERSAYAALGGPDAHYAALTARLNAFGQRLVRIATARIATARMPENAPGRETTTAAARVPSRDSATFVTGDSSPTPLPSPSTVAAPDSAISNVRDTTTRASMLAVSRADESTQSAAVAPDSVSAALREMSDTVSTHMQRVSRLLLAAQQENVALEARRAPLASRLGRTVPRVAMLFAALIVGVSIGYLVAFVRELRTPTVGDDAEVEQRTNARVVSTRYVKVRNAPLPDAGNPSYALLHLSLTGMGEVAHRVHVIAERPFVASVVAFNLGAVAARESRAALVVEDPSQPRMLDAWLRTKTIASSSTSGIATLAIERDLAFDVQRAATTQGARSAAPNRYDITLLPSDAALRLVRNASSALSTEISNAMSNDMSHDLLKDGTGEVMSDVVICARVGATPLSWLDAVARDSRARNQRVRAVLLWTTEQPSP